MVEKVNISAGESVRWSRDDQVHLFGKSEPRKMVWCRRSSVVFALESPENQQADMGAKLGFVDN